MNLVLVVVFIAVIIFHILLICIVERIDFFDDLGLHDLIINIVKKCVPSTKILINDSYNMDDEIFNEIKKNIKHQCIVILILVALILFILNYLIKKIL